MWLLVGKSYIVWWLIFGYLDNWGLVKGVWMVWCKKIVVFVVVDDIMVG